MWLQKTFALCLLGACASDGPPAASPPAPSTPTPASLPPDHGRVPGPTAEACRECRYQRVIYGAEGHFDEALLCAHQRSSPIKPFNARGALLREKVSPCDPGCCE